MTPFKDKKKHNEYMREYRKKERAIIRKAKEKENNRV